jgi:predicted MFS family arabinose efflux permease
VAAGKAFAQPAGTAALPNLVDDEDLAVASVLSGASWGTMLAVGAALGGLVAGTLGTTVCFVLDALLLLTAAVLTASTTRPFSDPGAPVRERRPVRHDLGEALGYARGEPRVLALIACKAGPAFGNGAISLFPLYGAAAFGLGPLGIGLMFSARGVGALLGPLLLRRQGTDPARLFAVLAGSMSVFGVAYLLLGATRQFWLVLLLLVLAHAGGGANWILSTYGMQRVVPDALRGRVFSADYTLATLVIACSQVAFGLLSDVVPARELLAAAGAVVLLYAAGWWAASRRLHVPDDRPRPAGA